MDVEIENNLSNNLNKEKNIEEKQNKFLESTFGKVINNAVDLGIKIALPNLVEDKVIEVKDAILENGFKEGIKEVINSAIDIGKSAAGIITGKFENIGQIQTAVKRGGLLDGFSKVLDTSLKFAKERKLISNNVYKILKGSKNTIKKTVSDNIESTLTDQLKSIEKLEKYCEKWKVNYEAQDFTKMERAYNNIEKYIDEVIPLENLINKAKTIENLQSLIESNGNNFNLSEDEIKLAEKLK